MNQARESGGGGAGTGSSKSEPGTPSDDSRDPASADEAAARANAADQIKADASLQPIVMSVWGVSCEGDPTHTSEYGPLVETTSDLTVDDDLMTFWRCAQKVGDYRSGYSKNQPDALGSWVIYSLGRDTVVDQVGIVNGWPQYDPDAQEGRGTNRYTENGRVTRAEVQLLRDGETVASRKVKLQLIDSWPPDLGSYVDPDVWVQWNSVDSDVVADAIRVQVTRIDKGTSKKLRRTAAIAEVLARGWQ